MKLFGVLLKCSCTRQVKIIWCWVNSVLYKNRNPGCVTLTFTCNYFSMKLCPTDAFVKYLCFIHKWAHFQVVRLIFIYVTFKLRSYCSLRHFNSLENRLCWTSFLDSVMAWPPSTESFEAVRQFNIKWRVLELPAFWKVSTLWTWHVLTVPFFKEHTLIIDITECSVAWSKYFLLVWIFLDWRHTSEYLFKVSCGTQRILIYS